MYKMPNYTHSRSQAIHTDHATGVQIGLTSQTLKYLGKKSGVLNIFSCCETKVQPGLLRFSSDKLRVRQHFLSLVVGPCIVHDHTFTEIGMTISSSSFLQHNSLAYSKKGCRPVQVLPVQHEYTKVTGCLLQSGVRTLDRKNLNWCTFFFAVSQ